MTLEEQVRSNRIRTAMLMLCFGLVFVAIGAGVQALYGGISLIVIAGIAFIYAIISWFANGRMIGSWTGAKPVTKEEYPELVRAVENAAIGAGLDPAPQVRVVDDPCPNAFTAGGSPQTSYVAATTGLLAMMNKRELEAVVAHEIGHVRNRDVRLMSLAAVLVGVVALVADLALRFAFFGGGRRRDGGNPILMIIGLVMLIVAPIAAFGIQMSLSRRREYLADESSASITGDAEGLALALWKLKEDKTELRHANRATAHLYIETPLNNAKGPRAALSGMFDTHPSLDARIEALEKMGGFRLPALVGEQPQLA
ncbi:MAG TPA: M48 family metalloprotease [Gaiellaceae bacterium]